MNIHVICRGNMFRSRLAEGYLKKHLPQATISSSGVDASHEVNDENGSVCWYTQCIADCEGFPAFLTPTWVQTTQSHLNPADIVIAMDAVVTRKIAARFIISPQTTIYN